jgi:hypothetical protein
MARLTVFTAAWATLIFVLAPAALAAQATARLPDLDELTPGHITVAPVASPGTAWQLGFSSGVMNQGPGPLEIQGNGAGDPAPMQADQIVAMNNATTTTYPAVGSMQYVRNGGHDHWHLLDFEHYELRSVSDPSVVATDHKTGFCLANDYTTDLCGWHQPELTQVTEGISVGGSDVYDAYREGQYVSLDPVATPAGDYYLVNTANPPPSGEATGPLQEVTQANNSASVLLELSWNGASPPEPSITVLRQCPDSPVCPAVSPSPGGPGSSPPSTPPASPPTQTVEEPAATPTVADQPPASGDTVLPAAVVPTAAIDRAGALDLARKAVATSTHGRARGLKTACHRASSTSYSCRVSWAAQRIRWRGLVVVGYRVVSGDLRSFYRLQATGSPGRRRIRVVTAQAARRGAPAFASGDFRLFCPAGCPPR